MDQKIDQVLNRLKDIVSDEAKKQVETLQQKVQQQILVLHLQMDTLQDLS